VRCDDESDQSRQVCARILEHHEQGMLLMAQAVLVRSAHHSDLLELELAARNIPFVKYGGLRFLEAAHVKDLLCLLRLAENPHDELAWFRLLQFLDGVGPATARRVTGGLVAAMLPLAALEQAAGATGGGLCDEARAGALDLACTISEAAKLGAEHAGPAVERVRRWLDPRLERRYTDVEARRADLEQLTLAAAGASTLRQFLADLTLDPPAATSDLAGPPHLDEDFITISTIHSAKGCEWDVVHILHVADGNIPSDLATGDPEAVEEERRLLYVAMTRARNHLYAYLPLRYHHRRFGQEDPHGYAQLTRFFTPAVLACLDDPGKPAAGPGDGPSLDHVPHHPAMQRLDQAIASLWD
jgi:DNA helicase-2/ATP-dependent DNA helicase PcrA